MKQHQWIAHRELTDCAGHVACIVGLLEPRRIDGGRWVCEARFEFDGEDEPRFLPGYGIDTFDAIVSALQAIRVVLARVSPPLSWIGEAGTAGFPVMLPDD